MRNAYLHSAITVRRINDRVARFYVCAYARDAWRCWCVSVCLCVCVWEMERADKQMCTLIRLYWWRRRRNPLTRLLAKATHQPQRPRSQWIRVVLMMQSVYKSEIFQCRCGCESTTLESFSLVVFVYNVIEKHFACERQHPNPFRCSRKWNVIVAAVIVARCRL